MPESFACQCRNIQLSASRLGTADSWPMGKCRRMKGSCPKGTQRARAACRRSARIVSCMTNGGSLSKSNCTATLPVLAWRQFVGTDEQYQLDCVAEVETVVRRTFAKNKAEVGGKGVLMVPPCCPINRCQPVGQDHCPCSRSSSL